MAAGKPAQALKAQLHMGSTWAPHGLHMGSTLLHGEDQARHGGLEVSPSRLLGPVATGSAEDSGKELGGNSHMF